MYVCVYVWIYIYILGNEVASTTTPPCCRYLAFGLLSITVRQLIYICHRTSSKFAWKSTPKCTWMCWRVCWFPGAIRSPVADPGCGSRTRRRPTSPKRPRLGLRSAMTLYLSLTGPTPPRPEPTGQLRLVTHWAYHQLDLPQHQSQPDWRHVLPSSRQRLLVEKACSQFRIRIKAVIETEGSYIE